MKLLADAMLGRLAKWLRILGYDTAYLADTDDFAVMRLARAEDRLVLTRDRGLASRRAIRVLMIVSEVLEDQLQQVWADVGLPPAGSTPRCPECNHPLMQADPALVAARVPPYVSRTQERFTFCDACDRVYWRGSHWQHMRPLIEGLGDGEVPYGLRDVAGSDKMKNDLGDS
jgi:uncharacterized protein with PIN domain